MIKLVDDSELRTCCKCNSRDTTIYDGHESWHHHKCEKDCCSRILCHNCYTAEHHKSPGGWVTLINSLSNHKIGSLRIESETGKGLIGEAVIAKVRGLEIVAIKQDNFRAKLDLSFDNEYHNIQVKTSTPHYGDLYASLGKDYNFDTLFGLCIDKNMKNIVRVYAIAEEELHGIQNISFRRSPHPSIGSKWERFRIDEKSYNDTYQNLMLYLKGDKYFGIEDINKWLKT